MMSDAETLARLRRRVAGTENWGTLRHLADAASELSAVCADEMLNAVADFHDRIADKVEALGGKAVRRRQAVDTDSEVLAVADDDPLLRRLCAEHGEPRADIAPELITSATRSTP
jgi:hypothetical protein